MRKLLLLALLLTIAVAPARAGSVDAQAVFERLTSLAGTWTGTAKGEGEEAADEAEMAGEVVHEIQVSAAGTVVMETMGPGTEHEMINMYHLDGEDLVVTHYCAGGNQPRMRLNREASTADKLVFDFDGGTNLDPAVDPHIHSAEINLLEDGRVDSVWTSHNAGKKYGVMTFHLARKQ